MPARVCSLRCDARWARRWDVRWTRATHRMPHRACTPDSQAPHSLLLTRLSLALGRVFLGGWQSSRAFDREVNNNVATYN
eukprot:scaffold55707_cov46-Phaeocystis_antarctica.AAC.1